MLLYDGGRLVVCERCVFLLDEIIFFGVLCWKDFCVFDVLCNWEFNWGLWFKVFLLLYLFLNGVCIIIVLFFVKYI